MNSLRPDFVDAPARPPRQFWLAVGETVVIFLAMFVQGASIPPDVNEVHYLGKSKHYWDPSWCPGDFFLNTADAHQVFYWAFGWLTMVFTLPVAAWIGRIITWALLAAALRRLCWAVSPRPGLSIVTAILFQALISRGHMAGEWVVGGVEAKGFAYALVFFSLGSLARHQWQTAMMLAGAATSFHVLVGGWSLAALAVAWLLSRERRPTAMSLVAAAIGALLLAAPGVWFALGLTSTADAEVVAQANAIYVYDRLKHHLVLQGMEPSFIARFGVLTMLCIVLSRAAAKNTSVRLIARFTYAVLGLAGVGAVLSFISLAAPEKVAGLLKFYWFRLADVYVPLGVALFGVERIRQVLRDRPPRGNLLFAGALVLCMVHLAFVMIDRQPNSGFWKSSPADAKNKVVLADGSGAVRADDWRQICEFFVHNPSVSPASKVLTPRNAHTFKWYAGLPEVGNWKDIPQDSAGIVEWMGRMQELHANRDAEFPDRRWSRSLTELGPQRLEALARKYGATYVVTEAEPELRMRRLYRNKSYAVYLVPWQRLK